MIQNLSECCGRDLCSLILYKNCYLPLAFSTLRLNWCPLILMCYEKRFIVSNSANPIIFFLFCFWFFSWYAGNIIQLLNWILNFIFFSSHLWLCRGSGKPDCFSLFEGRFLNESWVIAFRSKLKTRWRPFLPPCWPIGVRLFHDVSTGVSLWDWQCWHAKEPNE